MVLDTLENTHLYKNLHKRLAIGLDYIQNTDFNKLNEGTHTILGEEVFAMLQSYDTKPEAACRLEAHKKYIDIQYVIHGEEYMGVTPLENQQITEALPDNDVTFFEGVGSKILVKAGSFTIFFPTDLHAPCIQSQASSKVLKVVIKVQLHD